MTELMVKLSRHHEHSAMEESPSKLTEIERTLIGFDAKLVAVAGPVGAPVEYYRVEGVQPGDLGDLRSLLERCEGVDAAYIKPSDAMP